MLSRKYIRKFRKTILFKINCIDTHLKHVADANIAGTARTLNKQGKELEMLLIINYIQIECVFMQMNNSIFISTNTS